MPTVKAMAPKAPTGATFMTMATILKNTCRQPSSTWASGLPLSPRPVRATPKSTLKNTICRMSPWAKASIGLEGTIWVRNSVNVSAWPWAVRLEASPPAMLVAARPAPGRVTLTTMSPMASANVVTISK